MNPDAREIQEQTFQKVCLVMYSKENYDLYIGGDTKEAKTYLDTAQNRGASEALMAFLVDGRVEHGYTLRYVKHADQLSDQSSAVHYNHHELPLWR
jgi:hypothetical protein